MKHKQYSFIKALKPESKNFLDPGFENVHVFVIPYLSYSYFQAENSAVIDPAMNKDATDELNTVPEQNTTEDASKHNKDDSEDTAACKEDAGAPAACQEDTVAKNLKQAGLLFISKKIVYQIQLVMAFTKAYIIQIKIKI